MPPSPSIPPFQLDGVPRLVFGPGRLPEAAAIAAAYGRRVLLVTGARSFGDGFGLLEALSAQGCSVVRVTIDREPSPALVDAAVSAFPDIQVVIAVGGGAVIDAGKAISAMLPERLPVRDCLEGVGTRAPSGKKVPFVACPTTAGTGAEATKNAVLSEVGPQGFKKSLRHNNYIPDAVVIDPALACSCSPEITAACGMDALTQLIEALTSPFASPLTDAFARSGLSAVGSALLGVCGEDAGDVKARGLMAWGAFCSGVALAHAGLGVVHGLASPLGGLYPIPHGVVCGALLPAATEINIRRLTQTAQHPKHADALTRYAEITTLLNLSDANTLSVADGCQLLIDTLYAWRARLPIPALSAFGIRIEDRVIQATGLKSNPTPLSPAEISEILARSGAL